MSLSEFQACLARLYVDRPFLQLFEIDSPLALKEYRLNEEETRAVTSIDLERLKFFSVSLQNKRKGKFRSAFPLTFKLNKDIIDLCFGRFYAIRKILSSDKQSELYDEFGRFLEDTLRNDDDLPAFASQLVRYETLCNHVRFSRQEDTQQALDSLEELTKESLHSRVVVCDHAKISSFSYDFTQIRKGLASVEEPESLPETVCHVVFLGGPRYGQVKILKINQETHLLLRLSTGKYTVREIIREAEKELSVENLQETALQALNKLLNLGILRAMV